MNPITHHSVKVQDIEIHWREVGQGSDVILFLHGFPFDASVWDATLRALPAGWRGIAPDLRGFGDSEPGDQPMYTMDGFARDALALLDQLDVGRAVICGLSMGGYVTFQLWRLAPERVRGLVLVDTRSGADSPDAADARRNLAARVRAEGTRFLVDDMVHRLLAPETERGHFEIVETLRGIMQRQPAEAVARASLGMASRPDSTFVMTGTRVPTLIVVGSQDSVTPVAESERLRNAIHNSHMVVIPGAGHLPPLETPEAFAHALELFLGEIAPTAAGPDDTRASAQLPIP